MFDKYLNTKYIIIFKCKLDLKCFAIIDHTFHFKILS